MDNSLPAQKPLNLFQKMIEVRKSVPYLKKDNQGYQFKYVSSSQALGALRGKMDELGVLLLVEVSESTIREKTTAKGGVQYLTELVLQYTWIDADNPQDRMACRFYGQGIDDGEKGVGKALTYAEKYLLLKTFNIATDKDDPDYFQEKANTAKEKSGDSKGGSPDMATEEQLKFMRNVAQNEKIAWIVKETLVAALKKPSLTKKEASAALQEYKRRKEGAANGGAK